MAREVQAKRYAQAVFEIAQERKELDRWQSDLNKIVDLIQDETIYTFLASPRVHFDKKSRLIVEYLKDIHPLVLNLVHLLIARGNLEAICDIADMYQQLLDDYHGIEYAEVTTAVSLDNEEKQKLSQRLSELMGKKVTIKANVDATIVGGIVARIGDKLLDGSTRSKLIALKEELAGGGK